MENRILNLCKYVLYHGVKKDDPILCSGIKCDDCPFNNKSYYCELVVGNFEETAQRYIDEHPPITIMLVK